MDWLFTKGRMISDNSRFTHALATRLVESGVPIDACNTLATPNHRRPRQAQPPIEFGVGLNVGEACCVW